MCAAWKYLLGYPSSITCREIVSENLNDSMSEDMSETNCELQRGYDSDHESGLASEGKTGQVSGQVSNHETDRESDCLSNDESGYESENEHESGGVSECENNSEKHNKNNDNNYMSLLNNSPDETLNIPKILREQKINKIKSNLSTLCKVQKYIKLSIYEDSLYIDESYLARINRVYYRQNRFDTLKFISNLVFDAIKFKDSTNEISELLQQSVGALENLITTYPDQKDVIDKIISKIALC